MPELVDIQKLSNLEREVKLLDERRATIETFLQEADEKQAKKERAFQQEMDQLRSQLETWRREQENNFAQRTIELDRREKTIAAREVDLELVQKESEQVKKDRDALAAERKDSESLKVSYLEREHAAKLLIDQYAARLDEIGRPVSELNVETPNAEEVKE